MSVLVRKLPTTINRLNGSNVPEAEVNPGILNVG
jgi:hypothetical protein